MQVPLLLHPSFSQVIMYSACFRDTSLNNIISHVLVYIQNKNLRSGIAVSKDIFICNFD